MSIAKKWRKEVVKLPLAKVSYASKMIADSHLRKLGDELPNAIAQTLGVPGTEGALTVNDVEVEFQPYGPYDRHTRMVEITVFANRYPEREANLKERGEQLRDRLDWLHLEGIDASIWVLLAPGTFHEV